MSMSDNELARALFPKPRDVVSQGMGGAPIVTTAYGHAVSDSESGTVTVVLDGEAGGVDAEIDVPTGARILEGDQVMVTVSGTSPVDAVAAGWGDTLGDKVDSVTNYFWHDTAGAHVATVEGDATTGQNVLIDSNSLDIRSGSDVLASFDADGLHLYNAEGVEIAYFTEDEVKIGINSAKIILPYSAIEYVDHETSYAVEWKSNNTQILLSAKTNDDPHSSASLLLGQPNETLGHYTYDALIDASDFDVMLHGYNATYVNVSSGVDESTTPTTYTSIVSACAEDVRFIGHSAMYNKSMDGFIADLQGGAAAADYVVDEGGTSADHRYRKWASGKLEQWVRHYTTTTINTTWGNLYRTSSSYTGETWPVEFDQIYHCYTTVTADGGDMAFVGSASAATTTRADNYYLLRGAALTTAKGFMISSYGVGTWK